MSQDASGAVWPIPLTGSTTVDLTRVTEVVMQIPGRPDIALRPEDVDPEDAMTLSCTPDGVFRLT